MSFWTRPLHAMTDAFTAAGFRIAVISEPDQVPAPANCFPAASPTCPGGFLCFLFFVLSSRLTAARGRPPVLMSSGRQPRLLLLQSTRFPVTMRAGPCSQRRSHSPRLPRA